MYILHSLLESESSLSLFHTAWETERVSGERENCKGRLLCPLHSIPLQVLCAYQYITVPQTAAVYTTQRQCFVGACDHTVKAQRLVKCLYNKRKVDLALAIITQCALYIIHGNSEC